MRIDPQKHKISQDISKQCQKGGDDEYPHNHGVISAHCTLIKEQSHTVYRED